MTKAQRKEYNERRMQQLTAAHEVVSKGVCPQCDTKLYRNLALTGWYQCGHRGAAGFQKEAGPHCDFQIFFDPTPEQYAQIIAGKQAT